MPRQRDYSPDQFNPDDTKGLTPEEASSACGIVAAVAFARINGRYPTVAEARDLAKLVGWNAQNGMAGVESEYKLLQKMGIASDLDVSGSWASIQRAASSGHPVIVSATGGGGHYFTITDFDPKTGRYYVGVSGRRYRGGSDWMTSAQMEQRGAISGAVIMRATFDQAAGGVGGSAQNNRAPMSPAMERYRALVRKYFPADQVEMALAVMNRESEGNKSAHATDGEDSRGLFQVNVSPNANPGYASRNLYDPETNIRTAAEIYKQSGWSPWATADLARQDLALSSSPRAGKGGAPILDINGPARGPQEAAAAYKRTPTPAENQFNRASVELARLQEKRAALEQAAQETGANGKLTPDAYDAQDALKDLDAQIPKQQAIVDGLEREVYKEEQDRAKGEQAASPNNPWHVVGTPQPDQPYIYQYREDTGEDRWVANPNYVPKAGAPTPTPLNQWETVKDPRTGEPIKLRDPSTGSTIDLPTLPAQQTAAGAYAQGLDIQGKELANEKARRDLIPDQLLMIQNIHDTITQVQAMMGTDPPQISPAEGAKIIDEMYAQMESALRGTTPFQEQQNREQEARLKAQIGAELLNQRLTTGAGLTQSLTNAALGSHIMLPEGAKTLGLNPLAMAQTAVNSFGGGQDISDLAQALLHGIGPNAQDTSGLDVSGVSAGGGGGLAELPLPLKALAGKQMVQAAGRELPGDAGMPMTGDTSLPGQPRKGLVPGQAAAAGRILPGGF